MEDIKEAYFKVPPVSRYFMTLVFILSFATTYKILSPYTLILDLELTFFSLQVISNSLNLIALENYHYICICRTIFNEFPLQHDVTVRIFGSIFCRYYTFKGCEDQYKNKYPDFAVLLLFNAFAVFVIWLNFIILPRFILGFMEIILCSWELLNLVFCMFSARTSQIDQ